MNQDHYEQLIKIGSYTFSTKKMLSFHQSVNPRNSFLKIREENVYVTSLGHANVQIKLRCLIIQAIQGSQGATKLFFLESKIIAYNEVKIYNSSFLFARKALYTIVHSFSSKLFVFCNFCLKTLRTSATCWTEISSSSAPS